MGHPKQGDVYIVKPGVTVVLLRQHMVDFFLCARINPFFEGIKPFDLLLEGDEWSFRFQALLEAWNVVSIHREDLEVSGLSKRIGQVSPQVVIWGNELERASRLFDEVPEHLKEHTGSPYEKVDPRLDEMFESDAVICQVRRLFHEL